MPRIGVIGLGLLGSALAQRLQLQGWEVVGFDLLAERRQALADLGGEPLASPREVVQAADTVLFSLPDSHIVRDVVDTVRELLGGKQVIDTTTGDPQHSAALGAELASGGCSYLDATVVGSSEQARQGDVLVMVGGERMAYESSQSILRSFASQIFHVGPCGSGATAKLVVNLVLGLNRAVLAEGLSLARSAGLNVERMLEILRSGAAYSRVMDTKGRKMVSAEFAPQARLSQHLKDVRLILELGRRQGKMLPLSATHQQLLEEAERLGWGESDNSAVICAYEGASRR
jgi:3-hydroxyisobutyrate dehydrogenase-like beta-hydroxyacid dehydrogenase